MSDGQFIESLKANPAYQGIDIDRELGRMDAWLLTPKGKGRKKTRQFVVAWLNRIDRPMDSAERPIVPGEAVFRRFVERHGGEA